MAATGQYDVVDGNAHAYAYVDVNANANDDESDVHESYDDDESSDV